MINGAYKAKSPSSDATDYQKNFGKVSVKTYNLILEFKIAVLKAYPVF